uniref:FIST C-domain domain-containing protein n=1 Tax=Glycine max TaxID=3847 RepID=A0A0R0KAC4_SOYBN
MLSTRLFTRFFRSQFDPISLLPISELDSALPRLCALQSLGSNIPVIVTVASGIMGRDAVTDEFKEVKWGALFSGFGEESYTRFINEGLVLTVGYLPGLKVEAVPLRRPTKTQAIWVDNFIKDIKEYSASVSSSPFPVGIILFGEASSDMKLVLEKLDHAMPMDTVIVGDERGSFDFVHKSGNDSRIICSKKGNIEAVALVFARDRNRSLGTIRFHVALSNGVSTVGPRYKAASVKSNNADCSTWLTARREGQQENLDGQSILLDINNLLDNHVESPDLHIGVIKHRKLSTGAEKPMPRTCISYHGVVGGDEEYLYVDGIGIKTGDFFQFYYSDPNIALASLTKVHDALKSIKLEKKSKSSKGDGDNATNVFGGIIFACYSRGESFFGRQNVDSSPFLENFPGVPVSGIFCGGEMVRPCTTVIGQCEGASPISCCLHVYSTVYLAMSYTPPSVED